MVGDITTWVVSELSASHRVSTTAPITVTAASLRPSRTRRARPQSCPSLAIPLAWLQNCKRIANERLTAAVTADDEALAMALLGVPGDNDAALELWLLFGPH